MIYEPTLESYSFFLRRVSGDTASAADERRAAFEQQIAALLGYIARLSGRPLPEWQWPEEGEGNCASQLILSTGWLDGAGGDGPSAFAAAYIYGDMYCLQAGVSQAGQAGPEVFARLEKAIWRPEPTHHFLGSSTYLCGIVPAGPGGAADPALSMEAALAMQAYTGRPVGTVAGIPCGETLAWLVSADGQPDLRVLFYPDAGCEARAGEAILNRIAPRLELYRHKAGRQIAWCEANLPVVGGRQRALAELLDGLPQTEGKERPGSSLMRRLVSLYRDYESSLGMLADRQITIEINLHNLAVVLEELGSPSGSLPNGLGTDRLWERQRRLDAALDEAENLRARAVAVVERLAAEPGSLQTDLAQPERAAAERTADRGLFPGGLPPFEADIALPRVEVAAALPVPLTAADIQLLQHVYQGYGLVEVKKAFGGGYSGALVLLTLPRRVNGHQTALRVTKLGTAAELRRERDNYRDYIGDSLPYCVSPVEWERYYEAQERAGLSYLFIGGGALGKTVDLEAFYRLAREAQDSRRVVRTLDGLLDRELGLHWYGDCQPRNLSLAAEYGRHMVEHLRLRLRPETPDALWDSAQAPDAAEGYRRIDPADIPARSEAIGSGALVCIAQMVVSKVRPGVVKLRSTASRVAAARTAAGMDPAGLGGIVVVELDPVDNRARLLEPGAQVGVRGQVIYNRRGRMEEIACAVFPGLAQQMDAEQIELPGGAGVWPNPLRIYPRLLDRQREGSRVSYVHGDLHPRNVLVDDYGIGRLIDFARIEERHNLFDFIKLETYLRRMRVASIEDSVPLADYVAFEQSLAAAAQGEHPREMRHPDLRFAQEVILAIRRIVRQYAADPARFWEEYAPALFLYSLAVMKYYEPGSPQPTRLAFATACVLARCLPT